MAATSGSRWSRHLGRGRRRQRPRPARRHGPRQLVQNGHGQALADRLNQPQSLASVVVNAALDRHNLETVEGRVNALRAAAALVARIPEAPLSRVGAQLHARLAPYTDLGVIASARHRARRTRLLTRAANAIPLPTAQPG